MAVLTTSRRHSRVSTPMLRCRYLEESPLLFADGGTHIDPKIGMSAHGPKSWRPPKRHPARVKVGLIGSAETIDKARHWMETNARGVKGAEERPEFPGYQEDRGYFSQLVFDDNWTSQLSSLEVDEVLGTRSTRERFESTLALVEQKLRLLSERDHPPDYIVVCLPSQVYLRCRVADYVDPTLGEVHRDLRRALKSVAMKYRIPTQLLRQETVEESKRETADGDLIGDYPCEIAWDFFNALYFKAGGLPWGPVGLASGTCYIGVGFYRPHGSRESTVQTSLVQAFDEHGDGLVLRGQSFTWDPDKEGTKSPHLTEEQVHVLVSMVLSRYQDEMHQSPQRVVVHKTSRFWPGERDGFRQALRNRVSRYDLMALEPQSSIRLLTQNLYPPLRGTHFTVGDIDFLYTTGYLADLKQFHGVHVPSPLQIADHIGHDTPRDSLLREVLTLTKMNWNSTRLGGLFPVTIKFSKLVGDIMREIPPDREPLTNFKYYM